MAGRLEALAAAAYTNSKRLTAFEHIFDEPAPAPAGKAPSPFALRA